MNTDFFPDWGRRDRTGIDEAVFCSSKSVDQIGEILNIAIQHGCSLLLTRLASDKHAALPATLRSQLDYDPRSATAILGRCHDAQRAMQTAIVCAGTSDVPVALEAQRTLAFHGLDATLITDVGVAGLFRILKHLPALSACDVVIAVAGMEGALFSVLGGAVSGLVIAVPTSVGYGVASGGETALRSALATCAPGIAVVNVDNGFGAACIAIRFHERLRSDRASWLSDEQPQSGQIREVAP